MQNTFSRRGHRPLGNFLPVCTTQVVHRPGPWTAVTYVPSGDSAEKDTLQHRGMLLAIECGSKLESNTRGDIRTRRMDLREQMVQFKIRDVYYPDPTQVLVALYSDDLLMGKIVALSDRGMQKDAFVAVEVEGIEELMIVPVERLSMSCE
jgi:hypothetical protein